MSIRIDHVGLACADLARSIDFYVRLLAATTESRAGHTVIAAGDVRIAVVPRRQGDPASPARGHHVAFRIAASERAALLNRLAEAGADHEEVDGRLYTCDPDGYILEFLFE